MPVPRSTPFDQLARAAVFVSFRRRAGCLLVVDLVGELVQVGTDGIEELKNRGPSEVALSALDAGEVRAVNAGFSGYLGLRESCADAQGSQGAPEDC